MQVRLRQVFDGDRGKDLLWATYDMVFDHSSRDIRDERFLGNLEIVRSLRLVAKGKQSGLAL